jgi:hypothetical protein
VRWLDTCVSPERVVTFPSAKGEALPTSQTAEGAALWPRPTNPKILLFSLTQTRAFDGVIVVLVYVLWKIFLVYVMRLASADSGSQNEWNRYFIRDSHFWGAPFANWDGQHYLGLAQDGYAGARPESVAFYPLFPTVTRLLGFITKDLFLAAFVASTIFGLCFILQFLAVLRRTVANREQIFWGIVLFLSYPSAFYLTAIYPEGLVLFLFAGFFNSYALKQTKTSVVFALLLPWAKGQGLLLGGFLVVDLLVSAIRRQKKTALAAANLLALAFGTLSLLAFYWGETGNAFAQFDAQKHFVFNLSMANVFSLSHFLKHFYSSSYELFGFNNSIVDKIFIGFILLGFIPVVHSKSWRAALLYVVLALPTAMMGEGGSFVRHSLLLWPFVVVGVLRQNLLSRIGLCYLAGMLFMIQLYFASRFAANLWVG